MRNLSGYTLCIVLFTAFVVGVPATAQTWTTPQLIGTGAPTGVATNGTGTAAVIFYNSGAIQAAVAKSGTWGAPVTLVASAQTADIAVAPNGDVLAVWAIHLNNSVLPNEYQAAFYSGGKWGKAVTLSTNGYGNVSSIDLPSIGFDGSSRATLVWEQLASNGNVPCTVMAITGTAASGFGSAQAISSAGTCYGWTKLAVNNSGQAVAVVGMPGILSGAILAYSRDAGGNWSPAVTLQAYQYRQRQPRIALGNDGTAVASWTQRTTSSYAVRSPSGVWSAAATLPGATATTNTSFVAVDGSGNAVIAWAQYASPAGLLVNYRPVGGNWGTPLLLEASGPEGAAATAAGTFVVTSGDSAFVREAGSSTWRQTTFAYTPTQVDAASGQAIVTAGPQVDVSTAVVP